MVDSQPKITLGVCNSLLEALNDGRLNGRNFARLLTINHYTTMNGQEMEHLLSKMSKSQVANVIKALAGIEGPNIGAEMMRIVWVLLCLSTIVLTARLFVKWKSTRRLFYDDYCMMFALVSESFIVIGIPRLTIANSCSDICMPSLSPRHINTVLAGTCSC